MPCEKEAMEIKTNGMEFEWRTALWEWKWKVSRIEMELKEM